MNRTITLPELADKIAAYTGISNAESEAFVKDLFVLVAERLADGDDVTVKGLGRFAVIEGQVEFCPDAEFAEGVNMPFTAFEAIELDDFITPGMLDTVSLPPQPVQEATESESTLSSEPEPKAEPEDALPEPNDEDPIALEPDATAAPAMAIEDDIAMETMPADEPTETVAPDVVDSVGETESGHSPWRNRSLWVILFILWGVLCYFMGYMTAPVVTIYTPGSNYSAAVPDKEPDEAVDTMPQSVAQVPEPELAPEPVIVTDTVRRNRYLTTMAREHYGLMDFWVYIYEENADKLGNPDRIKPGTAVVIPPASKYGIDRNDPERVREAKLKASEIYAPYQK